MGQIVGRRGLAELLKGTIAPAVIGLSLCASADLRAYPEVRFEHLSLEHGLAQSAVQAMVSDRLGYVWFGTQYGLSRYDGYGFTNFRHDPNDPGSLSNSRIQTLLRCHDGSIFVGTRSGLNRLDPETLTIERIPLSLPDGQSQGEQRQYQAMAEDGAGNLVLQTKGGVVHYDRSGGELLPLAFDRPVPDDVIGVPLSDQAGRVWLYNSHGLWRFEADGPQLRHVLDHRVDERIVRNDSIDLMPSGLLALAGADGVVLFDPDREEVASRVLPSEHDEESDWVGALAADPRGDLWLLTRGALIQYDPESGRWQQRVVRWTAGDAVGRLHYALNLTRDRRGFVWIGLPEGVGLSSPDREDFRLLHHDPTRPHSLGASPRSAVHDVFVDDFGVVWVGGGLGGLSRFAPQSARFEHIIDESADRYLGVDNVVRSVLETRLGERQLLWTGLTFSGIRVWERRAGRFDRIVAKLHGLAGGARDLPNNEIWALQAHPVSGDVWAGTSDGLVVVSGERFEVLAHHRFELDGRQPRVKAMAFSDDGHRLWVAGGQSLFIFDVLADGSELALDRVLPIAPPEDDAREHSIFGMLKLGDGQLLIGTKRGIVVWDPDSNRLLHEEPAGRPGEHPRNFIFGLAQTLDGDLWIGSEQGGFARGRLRDGRFDAWSWFDGNAGLPDNTVYAILPEPSGRLWLSTNRGLVRFNPDSGLFRHFTLGDGLQALEFNNTVATIGDSGRYYFGGINGVSAFRPEAIELHSEPPRVYLQRAEITGDSLLSNAVEIATARTRHDRNALLLEFVGLHFVEPSRNRYAYRLEGVDPDWIESGSTREVRYPDLPPGDYRFLVRAANSDGVWSEPRSLLALEVSPPPWLTPGAYAVYAAALVLLITGLLMAEWRRRRHLEGMVQQRTQELLEQKRLVDRQADELAEVLDTRTILFGNISHEFRTPLTLIEASLDRLARNPDDPAAAMTARRYLRRLLRLADQLLNLSRLQSTRDQPVPEPWPFDRVIAMTVEAFRSLAEQRGIRLHCATDGRWMTQCQQADVERILLNLIGNALKYCPAGTEVRVETRAEDDGVVLSVSDDGPGISREQQALIFERFNRLPAHEHGRIEGAGIGLTLVREAARANGGRVDVVSEPGEGASFRVWLPAWRGHMEGAPVDQLTERRLLLELENLAPDAEDPGEQDSPTASDLPGRLGTALVAEDNADLRSHLAQALAGDWDVIEAADGRQALALARERMPDIVVSDIMMPHMDGLELLRRLREDVRTSHLPILLLTARQDEATRLQGFSLSADDFLSKPFSSAELRLRLQRMADIRQRIQARLWREMGTIIPEAEWTSSDDEGGAPDLSERDARLLDRVAHWLEVNHDDPDASIAALADFVAVDQRTLQRKLKALTGRTPAAHLQACRLECARRLLSETDRAVQDIALSCGFSSPQYFSRLFTKQEGLSPTQWRRKRRNSA